ncbi:hypothetical protein FOZ60_008665 [Perkinsus olseni]|uniref:Uncharacterized protein n=1 Tax=Perkinsus olseni TaxID=32597 RepID=A0A7J6NJW4_PEROL|nr:hypothetical protein FOZ60_008665 [Perkinsus olseni]
MLRASELTKEGDEGPWIVCHCMAHRLDLAVSSDMWKRSSICQRIERTLRIAYSVFNRSGQRRRELKRFDAALQDVRWLSKLQCLSILYWSKDSIAAFIARRNMARGDKTDWEQVDDIKDLELVIRQAAFAKSAAPMKQYISRGNRAGEPTAGYDADEVQKTIDEMEADRKAHD